jgi:drug/metabolite transporter (DMT)-like permease
MWLIYAICAAVLWGLNYSLSEKILHNDISPQTLLALQMSIGGIAYLLISYATSLKKDVLLILSSRYLLILLVAELVAAIIANYFISMSIKAKDATLAGLVEQSYPIFTVIFTWLLFKESYLTPGVIIGSLMIIFGIVIVAYY